MSRLAWAAAAVLAVCLTACSKDDEPQPPVNPAQENQEQWGDEYPHGFYFDLDCIKLPLNEDGHLCFSELTPDGKHLAYTLDSIVMDKEAGYDRSSKKYGIVCGPASVSLLTLQGKRATPFNNVEVYKKMCRTIGVRPDSKFNNFPELADLPVRKVYAGCTFFQLDTLVSVDIITHKYFNKDCPAGSSMRGSMHHGNFTDHPTYMSLSGASGSEFFDWWRNEANVNAQTPRRPVMPEFGLGTYTGEWRKYMSCIMPNMDVTIVGYPEKAGDYPMTIYMEFASGKTLSRDFKIRFVDEK